MIPRKLASKLKGKNIPVSTTLELTFRCNLKCQHCYQYPPRTDELTTQELKRIIDELAEADCLYLGFSGGEPLLRQDIWELARYARERNFALILSTNGTLLTPALVKQIKDLDFYNVHISILGATDRTHDEITQVKGSFQQALKAVHLLQESGIKVILKTTLMQQNFFEFRQIKSLGEQLGLEHILSPIIFPANDGNFDPVRLRLNNEQLKEFYRDTLIPKSQEGQNPFLGGLLCTYGQQTCCINAHGELYPCVALPLTVGNLRKESFYDIWTKSSKLNQIRSVTLSDLEECSKCDLASSCFRCPALSYSEDGSLLKASSECCRISKIIKEVIDDGRKEKSREKVEVSET